MSVLLRPLTAAELSLLAQWLARPHVARWWHEDPDPQAVRSRYGPDLAPESATQLLLVTIGTRPAGFAQCYRWGAYPAEAAEVDAGEHEFGIDYLIGEPDLLGRGHGSTLVAALVGFVQATHPGAGLVVAPEQANVASCRALRRNGFTLIDVRDIASEPGGPFAVYRRPARGVR